jgi:carboxylesterase type B
LYTYEEDPIFAGRIAASGSVGQIEAHPTDGVFWNLVSNYLGCGNKTDMSQVRMAYCKMNFTSCLHLACSTKVACMRNVSFEKINNATLQLTTYFGPFTDGKIILDKAEYLARGANGSFAHVPGLISDVNDEGSLFILPYSTLSPNGTTADTVADAMVCSLGTAVSLTNYLNYM